MDEKERLSNIKEYLQGRPYLSDAVCVLSVENINPFQIKAKFKKPLTPKQLASLKHDLRELQWNHIRIVTGVRSKNVTANRKKKR